MILIPNEDFAKWEIELENARWNLFPIKYNRKKELVRDLKYAQWGFTTIDQVIKEIILFEFERKFYGKYRTLGTNIVKRRQIRKINMEKFHTMYSEFEKEMLKTWADNHKLNLTKPNKED